MKENREKINEIIELIAVHEDTMGKLYFEFGKLYPGSKSFWNKISTEEKLHGKWVRVLHKKIKNVEKLPAIKLNMTQGIINSINHLEEQIKLYRISKFPETDAARMALELEKFLLEDKMLNLFRGITEEFDKVIDLLSEKTDEHIEKIELFYKLGK